MWSLTTGKLLHTETGAHEFRVKAVAAAPSAEATAGGSGQVCFASASSDGTISLWALLIGASGKPKGKKASKSDGEGIAPVVDASQIKDLGAGEQVAFYHEANDEGDD